MTLREIASLVDNFLTYWKKYPSVDWALLDSMLARTNRAFDGPLRVVSNKPLVVTGVVPIDSVLFLSLKNAPLSNPLTFLPGSLEEAPKDYALYQNYPNPFNPSTTIEFDLPKDAVVSIRVYDLLGREIVTLIQDEEFPEGRQEVEFSARGRSAFGGDASQIASGVYLYRIIVNQGEFQEVKKMLVMK